MECTSYFYFVIVNKILRLGWQDTTEHDLKVYKVKRKITKIILHKVSMLYGCYRFVYLYARFHLNVDYTNKTYSCQKYDLCYSECSANVFINLSY